MAAWERSAFKADAFASLITVPPPAAAQASIARAKAFVFMALPPAMAPCSVILTVLAGKAGSLTSGHSAR